MRCWYLLVAESERIMNSLKSTVFVVLAACLAGEASAQSATSFDFFITRSYFQASATTKNVLGSSFAFRIDGVNPSQFNYGSVDVPHGDLDGPSPYRVTLDSNYSYSRYFGGAFDPFQRDEFQAGDYTFNLGNNGVDEETASISYAQQHAFSNVPLLSQYDDLRNLSDGQAISLSIPGFTAGPGTNDNHTFYSLYDDTLGSAVLSGMSTDNGAFNLDILGGTLIGDHDYSLRVVYSNRFMTPNAGFGGAASYLCFDDAVTNSFHVAAVPEPTTMAGFALGAVALLRRRKK